MRIGVRAQFAATDTPGKPIGARTQGWVGAGERSVAARPSLRKAKSVLAIHCRTEVKSAAERIVVEAEDALIAALKVKAERPEATIMYVRRLNRRGDTRLPPHTLTGGG